MWTNTILEMKRRAGFRRFGCHLFVVGSRVERTKAGPRIVRVLTHRARGRQYAYAGRR